MELRQLTDKGLERYSDWLDALRQNPKLDIPRVLLDDADASEPVAEVEVQEIPFTSRFEASAYLHKLFTDAGLEDVTGEAGLWGWLSVLYFDQLCPSSRGERNLKQKERYFPDLKNFLRYYRHALAGSYLIYHAHKDQPERTKSLLYAPLSVQTDLLEQLASRQWIITNKAAVEAATALYYDASKGNLKRGAGGSGKGSPRRLKEVLDQFDLTFDLYGMKSQALVQLLPKEFDRFRQSIFAVASGTGEAL